MAKKVKLTKLLASIESEDGVARPVDVKETSSELGPKEVQDVADDGSGKGDVAEAAFEVEVDGKDFTAIDEASKRQGEAIHKKLERLEEACASTEAYIGILRGSTRFGLESATASVIAHDLKGMYPKFFSKLTTSLEAIDDDAGQLRIGHTKEAEKEATGRLAKLKETAKGVIEKFLTIMREFFAKIKQAYTKVKEAIKGDKAKSDELKQVIKALPAPGQPVKATLSLTAGTKAGEALKKAAASKEPVAKPPAEVTLDPTNLLTIDGEVVLDDSTKPVEALDFFIAYCAQVKPAVDKSMAALKQLMDNPREGTFDNAGDKAAIDEIISSTVGKVALPTFEYGGSKFVEGERGAGFWSFKAEGESGESTKTIPLPSKQELEKWNDAAADIMDKADDVSEASKKATEALEEFTKWLETNKSKFTNSVSNWILFPTYIRTNLWTLTNHTQRVIQQRLWAIDSCTRAHIAGNSLKGEK